MKKGFSLLGISTPLALSRRGAAAVSKGGTGARASMKTPPRWIGISILAIAMAVGLGAGCPAGARLDISESQKDQLKALASNTRDRTGRERETLRQARTDLLKAYSTYDIDDHKVKAACDKIGAAQLSLLNVHLDNEIALRGIFTEDQFKAFREMMKKRMRDPQMLVLAPPEEAVLERLPDKQMLDSLGVPPEKRKRLDITKNSMAINGLRDTTKQLLDMYSTYSLDSAAARKLIESMHHKQTYLLMLQSHRQQEIRHVLTVDQFKKLQEEITKRISERGLRGGPGRDRDRDRRH
jgi:Spy/CpxP family protein refolding chaperone